MDWQEHFSSEQIDYDFLEKILQERRQWPKRLHENRWMEPLDTLGLPPPTELKNYEQSHITIGKKEHISEVEYKTLREAAKKLIPWKKGPFNLFGLEIDGEWRSDHKWQRIEDQIGCLEGKKVLDIGCNNGYFMYKMLRKNPLFVLGIDPVVRTFAQFEFIQKFAREEKLFYELLGVEHLKAFRSCFDVIFNMGIIYHHRHPLEQLHDIREALAPGGTMILETIGIQGEEPYALFPPDRYAKMRNVWFVPTLSCLVNWVRRANFEEIKILPSVATTEEEQRWTEWCPEGGESLKDFLDPLDASKTIEGHPAPWRMTVIAKKKKG